MRNKTQQRIVSEEALELAETLLEPQNSKENCKGIKWPKTSTILSAIYKTQKRIVSVSEGQGV